MTQPAPAGGTSAWAAGYAPSSPGSNVSVGTQPVAVAYVPYQFERNQGLNVPGLGHPAQILEPPNSHGLEMGITPHMEIPGTGSEVTLQQGLLNLMLLGQSDQQGLSKVQQQLIKAGYLNPSDTTFIPGSVSSGDATYYAYAKLLNDAVITGKSYNKILQQRINSPKNTTGQKWWETYQEKVGLKPITKQSTTVEAQLTDAPDAKAVAQNEFQNLLGRNVNDQEAQAFQGALNAYEQAHPTVRSSSATYDPQLGGQVTNSNSTVSGGINQSGADQIAQSDILQNHGAEYAQAQGDQLYQLFSSMLAGG